MDLYTIKNILRLSLERRDEMEINNLSDSEVEILLNRLKNKKNPISFNKAYNTISSLFGKIDVSEGIIDSDDIEYILHVYRGRIETTRFSIHLRFKESGQHLIRVDMDPHINHNNPNGKKIIGSHIHIYNNTYDQKDLFAYPLREKNFPELSNIIDAFEAFLNYTNIK